MSVSVPIDQVMCLIADAAAAEIKPRFGCLGQGDVREKAPNDLVTVADLAMEARLTPALAALVPGSLVVGEEAVAADPSVQDRLSDDRPVWVIDPVDGTSNFAHGRPMVAVIVALVLRGETVGAWIHDPLTGITATAEAGAGAWCQGQKLAVIAARPLPQQIVALNLSHFPSEPRSRLKQMQPMFADSRPLFCAGQEYLRMVRGQADGALFWRLKPWDHAAGILLHREAGGYSARLDGMPYRPTDRAGGLLATPDRNSWQELRSLIGDIPELSPA